MTIKERVSTFRKSGVKIFQPSNKWRLFILGMSLLVYMVGIVNLDATMGCYEDNVEKEYWEHLNITYTTICHTWDLFGRNSDLKNSYHSALLFINFGVAGVIYSVLFGGNEQ